MSIVHVYSAPAQLATQYTVSLDVAGTVGTITIRNPKNRAIRADCCGFRRCARNLTVQVYFDLHRYTCVKGKGCKRR